MTTLTVALPLVRPTVGTEFSYVLSQDSTTPSGHGIAPLALLPAADALVLVVPARLLSWHVVRLPPVARNRLRMALDGALEDHLLDEPEQLAFALAPQREPDGSTVVAVLDKAWLRAVLAFFEEAQRPAGRVVPEFAPAGADARALRMVVTGSAQEPWLALVDTHNVLCTPLVTAAELLASDPLGGSPVFAEPEVAALAEHQLARSVEIQPAADRLLECAGTAWELAQFDLAISHGGRIARRWAAGWELFVRAPAWRPARWGLLLLLLVNLAGLNAWAWQQEQLVQAKREQVKTLLSQSFPQVRTIVDAPLQMERELARLRQASGGLSARDLEVMLGAIGSALPPGSTPTAITYSTGEAAAKGLGLDAAQAAQVLAKLAGRGYTARLDGEQLLVRMGARP